MNLNRPILFLFLLALCSVVIILYSTQSGFGLGNDSFFYISGADNIQASLGFSRPAGDGSVKPITHFPPLYSLLLAFVSLLGVETQVAARWLNAILFGANTLILGMILYRLTDSILLALIGSFATLTSPVMISVHSWALTEPLFICFELLAIWFLIKYLDGGERATLLLASIMTALVYLVRYIGSTFILTGIIVLLLPFGRSWRRRVIDCILFIATSLVLPLMWMIRNIVVSGSATNRLFMWHPITLDRISEGLNTVSLWLMPSVVPEVVRHPVTIVVMIFLVGVSARQVFSNSSWRRKVNNYEPGRSTLLIVVSVFINIYIGFLVLSISFFDASTPLDNRVLSPLFPSGILLTLYLAHEFIFSTSEKRWAVNALSVVILGFIGLSAFKGVRTAYSSQFEGKGFSNRGWRETEVIQWIKAMPDEIPIYTNELDALYLLTKRVAYQIPIKWDPVSATMREDYEHQLTVMRARMHSENGILVLFPTLKQQLSIFPHEEELADGLSIIVQSNNGAIYQKP